MLLGLNAFCDIVVEKGQTFVFGLVAFLESKEGFANYSNAIVDTVSDTLDLAAKELGQSQIKSKVTASTIRRTFITFAKSLDLGTVVDRIINKTASHTDKVSEENYNRLTEGQVLYGMVPLFQQHQGIASQQVSRINTAISS